MPPRKSKRLATPSEPAPESDPETVPGSPIQEYLHEEAAKADQGGKELSTLIPKKFFPGWAIPFVVPLLQGIFSLVLYTLLEPLNSQLVGGLVDSSHRIWAFDITRLVLPAWLALANHLDANAAFCLMWILKTPFYTLLFIFYELPTTSFLLNVFVDSTSLWLAFIASGYGSVNIRFMELALTEHFVVQDRAVWDNLNILLTVLMSTSLLAVGVKLALSDLLLPFIVRNFYPVETLEIAHDVTLFQLGIMFLPMAIITRQLLYKAPVVFLRLSPFRDLSLRTRLVLGRHEVIFMGILFENTLRIATTVGGASWEGAAVWSLIWALMTWVQALALAWVEAGVEVDS